MHVQIGNRLIKQEEVHRWDRGGREVIHLYM